MWSSLYNHIAYYVRAKMRPFLSYETEYSTSTNTKTNRKTLCLLRMLEFDSSLPLLFWLQTRRCLMFPFRHCSAVLCCIHLRHHFGCLLVLPTAWASQKYYTFISYDCSFDSIRLDWIELQLYTVSSLVHGQNTAIDLIFYLRCNNVVCLPRCRCRCALSALLAIIEFPS